MKRFISVILCVVMIFCFLFAVNAADDKLILGDADLDGEISIMDATRVQRTLAELDVLSGYSTLAADVDRDSEITILDATRIQRFLAELCNIDGSAPYNKDLPFEYINLSEQPTESTEVIAPTETAIQAPTSAPMLAAPRIAYVSADNTGAVIHWDLVEGAVKYRAFVKQGSSWKTIGDTASDHIVYKGAVAGTVYTYTVRCISSDGSLFTSDYDHDGYSAKMLATPSITSITNSGNQITIKWGAVSGASKYRVFIKNNGSWKKLSDTASTSYVYTHPNNTSTDCFTVRCVDSGGSYFTSGYDANGTSFRFIYETEPVVYITYVASVNSDVFHRSTCPTAKNINARNLIVFSSRSEAVNSGRHACRVCKP